MKYGVLFEILALLLATMGLMRGGGWLTALWPSLALGWVGAVYLWNNPRLFGKRSDGVFSPWSYVLLLPYLGYVWLVWHLVRILSREPMCQVLTPVIIIGRRPLAREVPDNVRLVVDLTCEFSEGGGVRSGREYLSFPILDASFTSMEALSEVVESVASREGAIYIHCAQGHGRTGLFTAALLLRQGHVATVEEALEKIRAVRPGVRLNTRQRAALDLYFLRGMP